MGPLILGVAGSLRNGRWGSASRSTIDELTRLSTEDELERYLHEQADLRLNDFVAAGRADRLPFDQMYENLRTQTGKRGLSNSEVALAAAMWAAHQAGARLDRVSLVDYFPAVGGPRNTDELAARLAAADGLLVSTPVYFGDRGSLCQSLIELIRTDPSIRQSLRHKAYAGIAVGAKRNGGQETTLVYQLLDMIQLGVLGVGNDSETTSQYGGTVVAGDVGTAAGDDYGLGTSMGTGRRIAHAAALLKRGREGRFGGRVRVLFWVLQDSADRARRLVDSLVRENPDVEPTIMEITHSHVARCIACDVCPTHVSKDSEYRCIITSKRDEMSELHERHLDHDAIVPVLYCSDDWSKVQSMYQRFIERTRYLRRGDYALGDTLTAPLIVEEVGALQNMHMRATTSLIRHHTVASRPLVAHVHDGAMIDRDQLGRVFADFVENARVLAHGRLRAHANAELATDTRYNPVGYVLSAEKAREDEKLDARKASMSHRRSHQAEVARMRLDEAEES